MTDWIVPVSLAMVALLALEAILLAGKWRRRQWYDHVTRLEAGGHAAHPGHIRRALHAQRASDFLGALARGMYYVGAIGSGVVLALTPALRLPNVELQALKVAVLVFAFGGALALLSYWKGWGGERDRLLRKTLRLAYERSLSQGGLQVRDPATGVYTRDFWLHRVEEEVGRHWRKKRLPVACLVVEVPEVERHRKELGDEATELMMAQIAQGLTQNVRVSDVVCRSRGNRFAVALWRCPDAELGTVARRVSANLLRYVGSGAGQMMARNWHVRWAGSAMPAEAATPIQLLSLADQRLDGVLGQTPAREPRADWGGRPSALPGTQPTFR
jgi:diguanylate cyclase (GGDEF)-like protein